MSSSRSRSGGKHLHRVQPVERSGGSAPARHPRASRRLVAAITDTIGECHPGSSHRVNRRVCSTRKICGPTAESPCFHTLEEQRSPVSLTSKAPARSVFASVKLSESAEQLDLENALRTTPPALRDQRPACALEDAVDVRRTIHSRSRARP